MGDSGGPVQPRRPSPLMPPFSANASASSSEHTQHHAPMRVLPPVYHGKPPPAFLRTKTPHGPSPPRPPTSSGGVSFGDVVTAPLYSPPPNPTKDKDEDSQGPRLAGAAGSAKATKGPRMSMNLPSFSLFKGGIQSGKVGPSSGGSSGKHATASSDTCSPLFMKRTDAFVEKFLGKSVGGRKKLTTSDVAESFDGVLALVRAGSWKSVVVLVDRLLEKGTAARGESANYYVMQLKLFKIVSLSRLQLHDAVAEVFLSIPEFHDSSLHHTFNQHVPFSLYVLYAEFLYMRRYNPNANAAGDQLQLLLNSVREQKLLCQQRVKQRTMAGQALDTPRVPHLVPFSVCQEAVLVWAAREARVIFSLCNFFLNPHPQHGPVVLTQPGQVELPTEFAPVAALLRELLASNAKNPFLYFRVGMIFLQIGAVSSGNAVFSRMEALCQSQSVGPAPGSAPALESLGKSDITRIAVPRTYLVPMAKGLVSLAQMRNDQALAHFENARKQLEKHASISRGMCAEQLAGAVNCKAITLLYQKKHSIAISSLEMFVRSDPSASLFPSVVVNLSLIYSLLHSGLVPPPDVPEVPMSSGEEDGPPPPDSDTRGFDTSSIIDLESMSGPERKALIQQLVLRFADDDADLSLGSVS